MKRGNLFFVVLMIVSMKVFSQASLTIINKSNRYLTVKVMKGQEKNATLFKIDSVAPKRRQVIYLSEAGFYYTKSQAILVNKDKRKANDTIFSKDKPFEIMADQRGAYGDITLEFTIEETKKSTFDHIPITRKEYDSN